MGNVVGVVFAGLVLLHLVAAVALPFWIARDAERRDPDAAGRWVLASIFLGWFALVLWLWRRPPRIIKPRPYPTWYAREL